MTVLQVKSDDASRLASLSDVADPDQKPPNLSIPARRRAQVGIGGRNCEKWDRLMVAAQAGESQAYEQLLRELDVWLRRYYARRLPAAAAEDAKQEALLAIHVHRHAYLPSRSLAPWVAAIARNKYVDRVRDASRFASLPLADDIPVEDHGEATLSAIALGDLLGQLRPAQASVIRLVKLQGVSIARAACATGQSASLVKVNIHRGLKKLAALAAGSATAPHGGR